MGNTAQDLREPQKRPQKQTRTSAAREERAQQTNKPAEAHNPDPGASASQGGRHAPPRTQTREAKPRTEGKKVVEQATQAHKAHGTTTRTHYD